MSMDRIINNLKSHEHFGDRITHIENLPPKNATHGKLGKPLPPSINNYLTKKRIKLYEHQCKVIDVLRDEKNCIITTPTASGKTLAFIIPIFESLEQNKNATALFLYPTKALTNDQLHVLKDFERISGITVKPETYDGDTPTSKRPRIRSTSRIIISNPYELHQVLPWHAKWESFLSNLHFVVIDEAHQYRGVFGSSIAFLIRRLLRICHYNGSNPQFILSTATIANPMEFAEKLCGEPFTLIDQDSSPKGQKYFILYNPYHDNVGELSVHQETTKLFTYFVKNDMQTLCFTISRKMAELVTLWSRNSLLESEEYLSNEITTYRAGYLPKERRIIEQNLKNGVLRGVVSTNALELGIDVGTLDSVIISGFPGTIVSTWQQAGRAGRGINESIATLVAFENPLDQYFMKYPRTFFDKSHENAILDLKNPYITAGHVLCAAAEMPIEIAEDGEYFGEELEELLVNLADQHLVQKTPRGWVYASTGRATTLVNLGNIFSIVFKVIYEGKILETMDLTQAMTEAHVGAVLLHQGETYLVEKLDLKRKMINVTQKDVDFYTQVMKLVDVAILEELEKRKINELTFHYGEVSVTEEIIGYRIKKYDKVIRTEPLQLPSVNFGTMGIWFTIPADIHQETKKRKFNVTGSLHGIEHAMIGLMPFYLMCDRRDIGGVSIAMHPNTLKPTIIVYDGVEGGIGLTEKALSLIEEIFRMTYKHVKDCLCSNGCPSCMYSPNCGSGNEPMDKQGGLFILEELLARLV
ncbi:MAG: DEAD/DEAH box helicase [Candidatus Hodarchaeales archaeon]